MGLPLQSAGGLIDGSLSPQRSPPPARQHLWWARPPVSSRPAYLVHGTGQLLSVRQDSGPPHAQPGSGSRRPFAGDPGFLSNGISRGSRSHPVPRPTVRSRAGGWGDSAAGSRADREERAIEAQKVPTTQGRSETPQRSRGGGRTGHGGSPGKSRSDSSERDPQKDSGSLLRRSVRIYRGAGCRHLGRLRFYGQGP